MRVIDRGSGVEIIDHEGCLRLLGSQRLGRVAVVHGGRPLCLPVSFVLDGDRVVFRTSPGSKLDAMLRGAPVAFEVDGVDPAHQTGWSVMVSGHAEVAQHPDEVARLDHLPLRPWAPVTGQHWIVIHPDTISGRRIRAPSGRRAGADQL